MELGEVPLVCHGSQSAINTNAQTLDVLFIFGDMGTSTMISIIYIYLSIFLLSECPDISYPPHVEYKGLDQIESIQRS